jgi:uncharacterized glyoxalase superfamily protein PhnB
MDQKDLARPNIFPLLRYEDAPAALRWLSTAFGFEQQMVIAGPDGRIEHAEMRLGPGYIMLGSVERGRRDEIGMKSVKQLGAASQGICVFIRDVDAHYQRAKAAGAEIVRAPDDQDHGARVYIAKDLEGNVWSFGNYMPGGPRAEAPR